MKYEDLLKELQHKERSIDDLVSYIETRSSDTTPNYSLLLGAGASRSSGISTGIELVEKWREEIYKAMSKDGEYTEEKAREYFLKYGGAWYSISNEYSSLFEKKFDLPSQRRRFVEQEVDRKLPSIGYSYLVSLSNSNNRYFDTIYTTNFDDLINESFYQFSQVRPVVCAHDSSVSSVSINSSRPKVIKLHGDYLFDDIKSTLRETESLEENIKNKLIEFSKEYGMIVIGYAGNDRSVMDVISYLLKTEDYLKNGVYWCLRENDYINPDLRKLLWRDRVYFVRIDGFDELMAELHHKLKGALSLRDNFTDSKKDAIIESFTRDQFDLCARSDLISQDVEKLKKHKTDQDISNLIWEISEGADSVRSSISESDFKNLLNLDSLMKAKNFTAAKDQAEVYMSSCTDDDLKERYIKKLILINEELGNSLQALELCDKLIELDEFNYGYVIQKAMGYKDLTKRCDYIKSVMSKFEMEYGFHNFVAQTGLSEYLYAKENSVFSLKLLLSIVDKSIGINPSITNAAWKIKIDILCEKYSGALDARLKKEKGTVVEGIEKSLLTMNPDHLNYYRMRLSSFVSDRKYDKVVCILDDLVELLCRSSKSKRKVGMSLLCDYAMDLKDYQDNDGYKEYWEKIIGSDIYSEVKDSEGIVSVHILKALYHLNVEYDVVNFINTIEKVSEMESAYEYAGFITDMFCDVSEDYDKADRFLETCKHEIDRSRYYKLKATIFESRCDYDKALYFIEKSHEEGLKYSDYVSAKSYILLRSGKYDQVKIFVDRNCHHVNDTDSKLVLVINRELASKLAGEKVDDVAIRNVISRASNHDLKLCAESILNREVPVRRILKEIKESNFIDLFRYRRWPAIPDEYLSSHLDSYRIGSGSQQENTGDTAA